MPDLQPTTGVAYYTNTSSAFGIAKEPVTAILMSVCNLVCGIVADYNFFKSIMSSWGLLTLAICANIVCLWFVTVFFSIAIPWTLKLDYSTSTYDYMVGFRRFVKCRQGHFSEIKGVYSAATYGNGLLISLHLLGRRLWIETIVDIDEGIIRQSALIKALDSRQVTWFGRPLNPSRITYSNNDTPVYTQNATRYGKRKSRKLRDSVVAVMFLYAAIWLWPLFDHSSSMHAQIVRASELSFLLTYLYGIFRLPVVLSCSVPWTLSLDYTTLTYRLASGYAPFVSVRVGKFDDIAGYRMVEIDSVSSTERYVIDVCFKPPNVHKRYMIEPAILRKQAYDRVEQLTRKSGLCLVDASGRKVVPFVDEIVGNEVLTFNQDMYSLSCTRRQTVIRARILTAIPLPFLPLIAWTPVPGVALGPELFTFIAVIIWFMAYSELEGLKPWSLSLNMSDRRFIFTDGFRSFRTTMSGSFDELIGIKIALWSHYPFVDPYVILIYVKSGHRIRSALLETAHSISQASLLAEAFSRHIGVPVVTDQEIQSIAYENWMARWRVKWK